MGNYFNPKEGPATPQSVEAAGGIELQPGYTSDKYAALQAQIKPGRILVGLYYTEPIFYVAAHLTSRAEYEWMEAALKTGRQFTTNSYWSMPREAVYPKE